ncbi:bZIP transcription factor [Haloarchaeobius sp. HME9146]|uniref:DUF7518 family protein n=1 Tax=Haloarchaeobius sp. HME9146 TaxID=2978732 RepID=UPI0021C08728|nr:bZIP transcription factor [Haloarchaeobius sp. HME9146]MCT9095733.1 bZIP transcription factor [Haloarchaeobius sp. HME9146]
MPKNRVEDLEATVNELESTVRGLTEELVETKERVRILEAELEADPRGVATDVSEDEESTEMLTPEPGTSQAAQSEVDAAAARANNEGEGAKGAEEETDDESDESGLGDDIIVA